ncbi:MAG TPA: MFS transporter [Propionibacteriaceae bacterium]|nr:MFS transporter [Propionibacteriaceae bacterium]
MAQTSATVRRTFYLLTAGNTLAASLIWGINTIFLLDAGLSNFEAFTANAFFTAGMMLFEIPTGVVADSRGRRISFLWGTVTLAVATVLYVLLWQLDSPFVLWALVSLMLGLGYTFFSGATEAWLVDALTATKYDGALETVFARGQVVSGTFMLLGSVAGGFLAQLTNLGVPYVARAGILLIMFVVALLLMHDLGFTPERGKTVGAEVRTIVDNSVQYGLKVPAIRATMLSGFFLGGIGVYIFYALQPYLLELWGDPQAYGVAGLVAAIVAGAQIVGGLVTPLVRRWFRRRTSVMILMTAIGVVLMAGVGFAANNFWLVVALIVLWGLADAAAEPVRRAYLNGMIPSQQRATILSFDSLIASAGGIVAQPALGRVADVYSYRISYLWSAVGSALALPFLLRARAANARADEETTAPPEDAGKASATQIDA